MTIISGYEHRVFLETLDKSIKDFEKLNTEEPVVKTVVSSLKNEKDMLENLFSEFDNGTQQLKKLISQYQQVKRKMRIKLRAYKVLYDQQPSNLVFNRKNCKQTKIRYMNISNLFTRSLSVIVVRIQVGPPGISARSVHGYGREAFEFQLSLITKTNF